MRPHSGDRYLYVDQNGMPLQKTTVAPVSDLSDWVGIEVKIKPDSLFTANHTIVSVAAGSPASRAGLMIGDRILKIDDANISTMTVEQVMERLREAGPQMTPMIRRKGQKEAIPVLLTRASAASAEGEEASRFATPVAAPALGP